MRHALALASSGVALLAPALAFACPVCAQRADGGPLETIALGALIVAPWFAAVAVGLWIRRSIKNAAGLATAGKLGGSETIV